MRGRDLGDSGSVFLDLCSVGTASRCLKSSAQQLGLARVSRWRGFSDYRPRHLLYLLRACGCGRARVGDFARAGGFRARRGCSRAPGGCSRAPGGWTRSALDRRAGDARFGLQVLSNNCDIIARSLLYPFLALLILIWACWTILADDFEKCKSSARIVQHTRSDPRLV